MSSKPEKTDTLAAKKIEPTPEVNTAEQLARVMAETRAEFHKQLAEAQENEQEARNLVDRARAILLIYEHSNQASNLEHAIKTVDLQAVIRQRFTNRMQQLTAAYTTMREEPLIEEAVRKIDGQLTEPSPPLDPEPQSARCRPQDLTVGTVVLTLQEDTSTTNWAPGARDACRWGVRGEIVEVSRGHGLRIQVQHAHDDRLAWYVPTELHIADGEEEIPF